MVKEPLKQIPGKLFELDKVSEKYLWKSDIFSRDVTR